jgi:O-methyltransferase
MISGKSGATTAIDPRPPQLAGIRPAELYLDLLKKTLTYSLWPEPPLPITTVVDVLELKRPPWKRLAIALACRVLRARNVQLVRQRAITAAQKNEGRGWPACADTMIGLKRLDNLQYCVETALRDGIEGDLIETGVWRGGACIFMRAVLAAHGVSNRKVFVADSFTGLPAPDAEKYPADQGDKHHLQKFLAADRNEVENNFRKYGLLDEQVVFLQGWFKDTLPAAPIDKLAVLRLDGDMYGSTMEALTNLYAKLSRGGFCIVDDYGLPGCRQAVDDFRAAEKISARINEVDWMGAYWRKE